MTRMDGRQALSELADGQLQGEAFARCMEQLATDPQARQDWAAWHLVGDVLRAPELAAGTPPELFLQRLSQRLAAEPAFTPPQALPIASEPQALDVAHGPHSPPEAGGPLQRRANVAPANDGAFRWKLVAGIASVAAVASVGWSLGASMFGTSAQSQLAGAPSTLPAIGSGLVLAGTERGPMLRDAQLDEMLAAHRQLGGATALQAPAGFLRNATFDGPGR